MTTTPDDYARKLVDNVSTALQIPDDDLEHVEDWKRNARILFAMAIQQGQLEERDAIGARLQETQDTRAWPQVDPYMSDEDLTTAAARIKDKIDWTKFPKLAGIFEYRPPINRYWHELVALTLTSLEVNGALLNKKIAATRADVEFNGGDMRPLRTNQEEVSAWARTVFGDEVAKNVPERALRAVEEVVELAQACNVEAAAVHRLVDYVFSRPAGLPASEVAGSLVTIYALASALQVDTQRVFALELRRIWEPEVIERVRARQKEKREVTSQAREYPKELQPIIQKLQKKITVAHDDDGAAAIEKVNTVLSQLGLAFEMGVGADGDQSYTLVLVPASGDERR